MIKNNYKIIKKNIIITGSTGLLGNILYNHLKKNNNILKIHQKYSNPIKLSFNYNEVNYKIIKNFNPDYLIHIGSPTDKKKYSVNTYKKWYENSKKIFKLFNRLEKKNLFINIGSIKELINPNNFFQKNINLKYDNYSKYKFKFSQYLNKANLKKMNTNNLYLLPVYGANINSGIVYDSCKAIIENKYFLIKTKSSIRSFLYIDDFVRALTYTMVNKNIKKDNIILTSDKYDTIENIFAKQFIKYKRLDKLKLKDLKVDKFNDMSKTFTPNYKKLKLKNFTRFDKGFYNTIKWCKKNG